MNGSSETIAVDSPAWIRQNTQPLETGVMSWGAIIAGAIAAAALSLILLMLGTGLGLSSASPWAHQGVSAAGFGISTILWVTLTQLLASGMGGYLAGRLRTRWADTHVDEIHFRDTAHGFLAWAVASLATAALLASVIGSIINGGIQAGASVAGGVVAAGGAAVAGSQPAKSGRDDKPMGYFVDSLFRRDNNVAPADATDAATTASSTEVARIFTNTTDTAILPADDLRYIGGLVAQRTGIAQPEAEKRVADTYARLQAKLRDAETAARETADKARKASAHSALWLFISLLIGAFVASLAATYGGRQRDR